MQSMCLVVAIVHHKYYELLLVLYPLMLYCLYGYVHTFVMQIAFSEVMPKVTSFHTYLLVRMQSRRSYCPLHGS